MSDLISRQAAIDALIDAGIENYNATGDGNGMIHAVNVIKVLPSAVPERKTGRRLIDADVLKSSIDEHVYLVSHGHNESEYGITQFGVWQIIDEQPTVDIVSALPDWAQKIDRMYNEALGRQDIDNPLAWAIYQIWKEYDE